MRIRKFMMTSFLCGGLAAAVGVIVVVILHARRR